MRLVAIIVEDDKGKRDKLYLREKKFNFIKITNDSTKRKKRVITIKESIK